jgi:hypothetical protein
VSSDNGATWVDMTASVPAGIVVNNLVVSSTNPSVAVALCDSNTVIYTEDAAVSWSYVTTGTFVAMSLTERWTLGQVISYDSPISNIEAILCTASGRVARLSGGSLNLVGDVGLPTWSLYFDGASGVAGTDGKVHLTEDSGVTWTTLNGGGTLYGADGYPGKIIGLHLNAANEWIVAAGEHGAWRSGNLGATFVKTLSLESTDLAFDRRRPMDMWVSGDRGILMRSGNNGASWEMVRGNPLMPSALPVAAISTPNGETVLFSEGRLLSQWHGGSERVLLDSDPVTHVISAPDPNVPICYTLTDCNGIQAPFYTEEDLSAYVGQVVTFQEAGGPTPIEHPGCWSVTESFFNCSGSQGYISDVTVTSVVRTCEECKTDVCYRLTSCDENPSQLVAGNTLFADFVGKVIKICTVDAGGDPVCTCYMVEVEVEEGDCSFSNDIPFDGVTLYYDSVPREDCDCCLETPPPDPLVPPYQQVRYTIPKDFSQSTMTDCEITAARAYASLMERRMMWMRLGLASVKPPMMQMAAAEVRFRLAEFARLPSSGECDDETPCGCC